MPLEAAGIALLNMPAESRRAAKLNGAHDFQMRWRQGMGTAVVFAMEAKDVSQFPAQPFLTGFPCRPFSRGEGHDPVPCRRR